MTTLLCQQIKVDRQTDGRTELNSSPTAAASAGAPSNLSGQVTADIGSSLGLCAQAGFAESNTSRDWSADAAQLPTAPHNVKPRAFYNLGVSCWIKR